MTAYENLIHVLSPNSQERADVASIKSIVYSLGPSVVNLITPIIAQNVFHTNSDRHPCLQTSLSDNWYRRHTSLHTRLYKYTGKDSSGENARYSNQIHRRSQSCCRNKYFWIISFAGWIGFLELAYSNILYWLYNYGGACSGNVYGLIVTIYGNAALWGMIYSSVLYPQVRQKNVQVVTNLLNIHIHPCNDSLYRPDYTAQLFGWYSFALLQRYRVRLRLFLTPLFRLISVIISSIRTGERIDGMFAAVATIGSVITLITSSVIPTLQEKLGMNVETARRVVNDSALMARKLPGATETIGQMLREQAANGQDIFNASNALYDVDGVLIPLLRVLIIVAAIGATLNVIPFFFYDFTEKKQKAVVRVLKVRALLKTMLTML